MTSQTTTRTAEATDARRKAIWQMAECMTDAALALEKARKLAWMHRYGELNVDLAAAERVVRALRDKVDAECVTAGTTADKVALDWEKHLDALTTAWDQFAAAIVAEPGPEGEAH